MPPSLPHSFPQHSEQELREMSGLDLLRLLEIQYGQQVWDKPEHIEFAAISLVVELPMAISQIISNAQVPICNQ